jgi:glycosyltransferase involved in cell wall biosynthesis
MKKILIFSTAYLPLIGGAEIAVKEITDRTETIQFDMITARLDRKFPKQENIGKIHVYRIGIGWPLFDKYFLAFYGYKFAEKLNKKSEYNLIWAIMASYGGFAAMFFKRKNPLIPFLLTLQEGDDPEYIKRRVGVLGNLFKEIFRRADYIQAISNYLKKWAEEQGATSNGIEVVPNGAEFDLKEYGELDPKTGYIKFSKLFKEMGEVAIKDNLKENEKIIITVSRLVEKNGIEYLIKAMKELPDNYKLRIIGDGKLKNKLEKLTKELKLEERVKFHGEVKHEVIRSSYQAANNQGRSLSAVFARPSLSEGLGNVFLEAMSLSVPVIATPVGGIVDFLRDGETGWFCEVRDPHSIAEKVKYIFEEKNKERVWEVINNAKELVTKNYGWDSISSRMRNIFYKIKVKS